MGDADESINENEEYFDEKIKIMIIGETETGKTSLISRYCKNEFKGGSYLSTIGIDFQIKNLVLDSKRIRLQIWDTAGQERFRNIAKSYFHSSDGFIIVYDISNIDSFDRLDYWIDEIKTNSQEITKMVLVGNKCDIIEERKIPKEDGQEFAKNKKIKFFEVSAKEGININESFEFLVKEILKSFSPKENLKRRASKVLSTPVKMSKKRSCC